MQIQSITMYSNLTVDFFHMEEQSESNANIFVNNYIPSLNNNSRALVTFDVNNDLNGISDSALGYTFSVYREKNNSNVLEDVSHISNGSLSVIDYNVSNQNTYKYHVFKEDEDVISASNISNDVKTCWWNWSVTGINNIEGNQYSVNLNDVWLFNLNVESSEAVRNFNKTQYINFTEFPRVSSGRANFETGSISCLIGQIRNGKYVDTAEMKRNWDKFCTNGKLKLLKDRKGNIMLIDIMGSSTKVIDQTNEQVNTINFNWVQIGNTDNITIVGE